MVLRRLGQDRSLRRLLLVVVWLAVIDQFVPGMLSRLEHDRYETGPFFRFANSDVFALGPLVAYLREHPKGARSRTAFFGNSVIFGYLLDDEESIPAQYQALGPSAKVFSFAINTLGMGGSYLVAKAVVRSVDTLFVLRFGEGADKLYNAAPLIPMTPDDIVAFGMPAPNHAEQRFEAIAARWRLYAAAYRLQVALFGASTRHQLRSLVARSHAEEARGDRFDATARVTVSVPTSPRPPAAERILAAQTRHRLLWQFAQLIAANGKRGVFLQIDGYSEPMAESDMADFNGMFGPHATIVVVRIPPSLRYDAAHLTAAGSRSFAEALLAGQASRPQEAP